MPKVFLPLGKMNLEKGPNDGDHAWVIKDLIQTDHGYESAPVLTSVTTVATTGTSNPKGGINWRGAGSPRMYVGTTSQIFEVWASSTNDVSRITGAYTNDTYGPSFASYGGKCYMSNGVDRINSITVPATRGGTTNFSDITYTTDGAVISPKYICSHKNHLIGANIHMISGYGEIDSFTTAVGSALPNQPNNDKVTIVSTALDTAFVSIVGSTFGSDTVIVENMTLAGLTPVTSSNTFGEILRITIQSSIAGTVTVKELSGGLTIATFAPLGTGQSIGVNNANISGGSSYITLVASDVAETGQVGIEGTADDGTTIYDSQALNGTTAVQSNLKFKTVTLIDTGDVGAANTVTVTSHQFGMGDDYEYLVWISGTDLPEGYGDPQVAPTITGSDYRYLFDGLGKITGVIDGGDCFFVFKSGSIVRLDGPPFQPVVVNYNVGMRSGCVPYRQGDRIYFWSSKGLSYIDIRSNEVAHVFEGSLQRSIMDSGNVDGGIGIGVFPEQNQSTITKANAACKSAFASISGDPEYGLVFVAYYNSGYSYGATSTNVLCYNETLDSFTLIDAGVASNTLPPLLLGFDNDQPASYPGSVVKLFAYDTNGTAVRMYKFALGGLLFADSNAAYVRLPFKSVDPSSPRTRITKVKPVYNNGAIASVAFTLSFKVEIISISGQGKSWIFNGILSEGSSTYSKDGWYDVSSCPFADKHSIGMHFTATMDLGGAYTDLYMTDFIGFEVEFVQEVGRSV